MKPTEILLATLEVLAILLVLYMTWQILLSHEAHVAIKVAEYLEYQSIPY